MYVCMYVFFSRQYASSICTAIVLHAFCILPIHRAHTRTIPQIAARLPFDFSARMCERGAIGPQDQYHERARAAA